MLDQIATVADDLTEPHMHSESITGWDRNRHRKTRRWTTVQPGLLAQLHQSVIPVWSTPDDFGASSVPASRPPLAVEALSRHDEIAMAVLRWCTSMGLETRVSVESNVRALVGATPKLDEETAAALLDEMRQWRRWCLVLTGWEQLYCPAGVPCPIVGCGMRNSLRINLTNATALCRACGSTWTKDAEDDAGAIGVLADYIKQRTDRTAA
ncbi:DUF7341 domain-containing protein [Actinoplanes regularis]|uniref:DUF7341 domain-containing protein n=1 Tax=Actinoplanes regularis TaxID=52697 RepID=UPI002557873D|nr:hypothetical protein [Actinoplanes regularis]